ncbi:SET domain-containing protein [Schizophyllum commune Tattone D]|nr:SET domain-containing protein [Schizophyllum commune Tattone D]
MHQFGAHTASAAVRCVGGCRATSACSCFVQQQRETAENGVRFFGYKANGLLAEAHVPVFECTRNCSCSSECRNKASVVRKGLNVPLSIKKTQKKGWALFNGTQAIPAGHYVGSYVGEVLTATEADERERQYCASDRRYLFPLDFHYLTKAPRNSKLYEQSKRVIDSKRAGNYTRYLNHSCEPNLIAIPVYVRLTEEDLPRIAFFTSRIIRPEEELCISYSSADIEEEGSEPIEEADRCHCGASSCKGKP